MRRPEDEKVNGSEGGLGDRDSSADASASRAREATTGRRSPSLLAALGIAVGGDDRAAEMHRHPSGGSAKPHTDGVDDVVISGADK
jgi:hypothetical protein